MRHGNADLVAEQIQDGNGAAHHIHGRGKNIQYTVKGFFKIKMFIQHLTDFIQQGNFFYFFHFIPVDGKYAAFPDQYLSAVRIMPEQGFGSYGLSADDHLRI